MTPLSLLASRTVHTTWNVLISTRIFVMFISPFHSDGLSDFIFFFIYFFFIIFLILADSADPNDISSGSSMFAKVPIC